jgi:hypothetical protein
MRKLIVGGRRQVASALPVLRLAGIAGQAPW